MVRPTRHVGVHVEALRVQAGDTQPPQLLLKRAEQTRAHTPAVGDHLDRREGSLHPADDVTMLVLEVGE